MSTDLPSPWARFLHELDDLFDEPITVHCVGGFAFVAAYGLPRSTNDLDYFSLVPCNRFADLERMAGEGSALARKHRVYMHHAAVASVPEDYEQRMTEILPGRFKSIRLFVLDPYDLVLSKLSRNMARDREDVAYLAEAMRLDPNVLRARYEKELRPNLIGPPKRHDAALEFWLEAYFGKV